MGIRIGANVLTISFLIVMVILSIRYTKKKIMFKGFILLIAFTLYIHLLIGITLFPIVINFISSDSIYSLSDKINLSPFSHMINLHNNHYFDLEVQFLIRNYFGNIILFMPLGFLLPLLNDKFTSFKKTLLFGVIASLSIELMQFIINIVKPENMKITDIDDLILNTIGTILGYSVYILFKSCFLNNKKIKQATLDN